MPNFEFKGKKKQQSTKIIYQQLQVYTKKNTNNLTITPNTTLTTI